MEDKHFLPSREPTFQQSALLGAQLHTYHFHHTQNLLIFLQQFELAPKRFISIYVTTPYPNGPKSFFEHNVPWPYPTGECFPFPFSTDPRPRILKEKVITYIIYPYITYDITFDWTCTQLVKQNNSLHHLDLIYYLVACRCTYHIMYYLLNWFVCMFVWFPRILMYGWTVNRKDPRPNQVCSQVPTKRANEKRASSSQEQPSQAKPSTVESWKLSTIRNALLHSYTRNHVSQEVSERERESCCYY